MEPDVGTVLVSQNWLQLQAAEIVLILSEESSDGSDSIGTVA
jgi:hypothetical protein